MILIEKPKLKFLLAGRTIDVDAPREYRKGRVYTVGVRRKHAICHAVILNAAETADGWTLTIRQQNVDQAIYLAANPGAIRADYTTNPARAARESDGSPIEAVTGRDTAWMAKVARSASERDDAHRRARAHQARMERQNRNLSVSRVKWSAAPPASDISGRSF